MMRIIVAGSRSTEERQVRTALERCSWIGFASAIVSGTAQGADKFGERWAMENGLEVLRFPADWEKHGKRAGPLRNREMSENAEALVAIWDGASRGTQNMIELAQKRGLRVLIYRLDTNTLEHHPAHGHYEDLWETAEERAAMKEYAGGMPRIAAEREAGIQARSHEAMASSPRSPDDWS